MAYGSCFKSFIVLSTLTLSVAAPTLASAQEQCAPLAPAAWSYPADGETHVPLDADLTIWGDRETLQVTLNGEQLPECDDSMTHDLGQLAPDTEYLVEITTANGSQTIHFSTGEFANPGSCSSELSQAQIEARCAELLRAQECAAGEDPSIVYFWPSDFDVEGWMIRDSDGAELAFWPAECGSPCLFTQSPWADYELVEVSASGQGEIVLGAQEDYYDDYDYDCGTFVCSLDPGPLPRGLAPFALLGLVASSLWYRRRRGAGHH